MATTLRQFTCRSCGHASSKWLGHCPGCGDWATFREEEASVRARARSGDVTTPVPFPDLAAPTEQHRSTGIEELDRVLGGGLVDGAVTLLGGEPGIGKSTLLLQHASFVAGSGRTVLYASAEESGSQLKLRGERIGVRSPELRVLPESDVDRILDSAIGSSPSVLMVDSVQAVRTSDLDSVAGTVVQVRECASRLVAFAKRTGVPVWLVGHVTKDGSLAGPRTLEHVVDTVVHFEGDRHLTHRVLRAVKNRFGPSDEIGVFAMTGRGLEAVPNPSALFLSERPSRAVGSAVLPAIEGTRPLLVEIQALVGEEAHGTPRRTALGVDPQRLALILAILQRHSGLRLADRDVFVNVVGGLSVREPAADLAIAAAVASSLSGRALPEVTVHVGELGLAGEVRSVSRLDVRMRECARMGFLRAVVPANGQACPEPPERIPVRRWVEVRDLYFPARSR